MGGVTVSHNSFSPIFLFSFLFSFICITMAHLFSTTKTNTLKQNTLSSNKIFIETNQTSKTQFCNIWIFQKQEFWDLGLTRQLLLLLVSLSFLLRPSSFAEPLGFEGKPS